MSADDYKSNAQLAREAAIKTLSSTDPMTVSMNPATPMPVTAPNPIPITVVTPLPVTAPSTLPVSGTVAVSSISGTVAVSAASTLPVSGTVGVTGSVAVTAGSALPVAEVALTTSVLPSTVSLTTTSSSNVVTPSTGKSLRLRGYLITVTGGAFLLGSATVDLTLKIGGTTVGGQSFYLPSIALNTLGLAAGTGIPVLLPAGGILGSVNGVLTAQLSSAISGGKAVVTVWTSEE